MRSATTSSCCADQRVAKLDGGALLDPFHQAQIHHGGTTLLGDIPLGDLRPRHIRDFIEALKKKKKLGNLKKDGTRVETDELIAPRTVLHVYGTLRAMLNDAVGG